MRGLCISGGGSKGAFAVGAVEGLDKEYNVYSGSSTGILVAILVAAGKLDKAIELYTTLDPELIYDRNPFNKKGKFSKLRAIKTILLKKKYFGTTKKLLKLIRKNYTKEDHSKVLSEGKQIIVAVTNATLDKVEYKYNTQFSWEEFTEWVWVSTLAYPFTEVLDKNGYKYMDGGYSVNLPIEPVIERCQEIDAIVLEKKNPTVDFEDENPIKGVLSILRVLSIINLKKDIDEGFEAIQAGKVVNFIYTPYTLTKKAMSFNKKDMKEWYKLGLEITRKK